MGREGIDRTEIQDSYSKKGRPNERSRRKERKRAASSPGSQLKQAPPLRPQPPQPCQQILHLLRAQRPAPALQLQPVLDALQHIADQLAIVHAKELRELRRAAAARLEVRDLGARGAERELGRERGEGRDGGARGERAAALGLEARGGREAARGAGELLEGRGRECGRGVAGDEVLVELGEGRAVVAVEDVVERVEGVLVVRVDGGGAARRGRGRGGGRGAGAFREEVLGGLGGARAVQLRGLGVRAAVGVGRGDGAPGGLGLGGRRRAAGVVQRLGRSDAEDLLHKLVCGNGGGASGVTFSIFCARRTLMAFSLSFSSSLTRSSSSDHVDENAAAELLRLRRSHARRSSGSVSTSSAGGRFTSGSGRPRTRPAGTREPRKR